MEIEEIKEQIAFYKQHRRTLQYGKFWRGEQFKDNKIAWHCTARQAGGEAKTGDEAKTGAAAKTGDGPVYPVVPAAITGFFQTMATASEGFDRLRLQGLDPQSKYTVTTKPQRIFIKRFGGLAKHVLPIAVDPDGMIMRTVNKYYALTDCVESYEACGETLMKGIILSNQYLGTGYNEQTRLLSDFGSNLYVVELKER